MEDDEQGWTIVTYKKRGKKKETQKNDAAQKGINFEKNRPQDLLNNDDLDTDDSGDEEKEPIDLKNPLLWNKFALIGNIELALSKILEKYNISPTSDVLKCVDCLQIILNQRITEFFLNSNFEKFMENLDCKVIFVSVIPTFTVRKYGEGRSFYIIHIQFDKYLIAEPNQFIYRSEFLNEYKEFYSFLGNTHTHIPISVEKDDVDQNKKNFDRLMRILKDKQNYDVFQPGYEPIVNYIDLKENTKSSLKRKPFYLSDPRNEVHKCKLNLEDAHSGFAEVLEGDEVGKKIYLHNRRNCNRAFNQDIVNVTIFDYNRLKTTPFTGRVTSVIQSNVQPVNKIFLCHLICGKSNVMKPICNTIPLIMVDNKYAKRQVKENYKDLKNMKNVVNLSSIIQSEINFDHIESFANRRFVTIKQLNENMTTTVKEIRCVDSYRCDFIFSVLYKKWDEKYRFPFGEVIGLHTPDVKFENTLNLIKVSCDISTIGLDEERFIQEDIIGIKKEKMKELQQFNNKNEHHVDRSRKYFSLKHPNKAFNEIAYSFEEVNERQMRVGIHIVNVSKLIQANNHLDELARHRFFTFLLPNVSKEEQNHMQPDYLFSTYLTTEILSIQKDKETDVISCYLNVNDTKSVLNIECSSLTFEKIHLDMEIDVNITDNLINNNIDGYYFLNRIYEFCQQCRYKRIKDNIKPNCFYPNFELKVNETALVIEEELQFLINKRASLIHRNFRDIDSDLLNNICTQAALNTSMEYSPVLYNQICRFVQRFHRRPFPNPRFSKQFIYEVLKSNSTKLFNCESLCPDVNFHHHRWKRTFNTEITDSYCMFHEKETLINGLDFVNYFETNKCTRNSKDIACSKLLSITNPLSCYLDAVLQRIITTKNKDDDIKIQFESHLESYEKHKISFDKYWQICNGYEIRHLFDGSSFVLDCVYEEHWNDRIFFHHPFLEEVNYENFIFYKSLNLCKVLTNESSESECDLDLTWKARIFLYNISNSNSSFELNHILLEDIYSFRLNDREYSKINSDNAYSRRITIQNILTNKVCKKRITSEIIKSIDTTVTLNYFVEPRQIMRIQFGYDYSNGIMKIIPELWIINPDFRICLCHRSDPLKYFMNPQELMNISYERFNDIKKYKSQFIILNRLEGIYQTINSESSFYIHDLKIIWIAVKMSKVEAACNLTEDNYGIIVLEEEWCKERFLRLVHEKTSVFDSFQAIEEAVKRNKMDYLLCIQTFIEDKNVYWIGHCRMSDVCLIKKDDTLNDDLSVHLTIKLIHSSFPMKHSERQLYSIEVMETPISTRIFEKSLKKLQPDSFAANIVMRNIVKSDRKRTDLYNNTLNDMVSTCVLNERQKDALQKSTINDFTLIWGPPGTGKTMIGCIIAYHYVLCNQIKCDSSMVLYCGPSNQSVNVVAEKLLQIYGENCPRLLRIFNSETVNFDFPYPGRKYKTVSSGCPDSLKKIALHYIVRTPGKPYAEQLQAFENIFLKNTTRNKMERIEYAIALKDYESCLKKAFKTEIRGGNYNIILTTAASSCKKLFESKKLLFSQIIMDECGMCSELEAISPFANKPNIEHLVLIGDHKQLRPIITCQEAKEKGLTKSLFERLYNHKKDYCIMLDTQYRMHPSICEFPNEYFYGNRKNNKSQKQVNLKTERCESWTGIPEGKVDSSFNGLQYISLYNDYKKDLLKNDINIADKFWKKGGIRKNNFNCYAKDINFSGPPVYEKILFINTLGIEVTQEISCSTGSNKSKCNETEARVVEYLYKRLITNVHSEESAAQSILIITQYRLQESILRDVCQEILDELKIPGPPRVSTVVKSQGSESDYVIFSTVRSLPNLEDIDNDPTPDWVSKYLGFITDDNQLNVALTRARKGLFIIGNSHLLSVNKTWLALINNLKRRECFVDDISD